MKILQTDNILLRNVYDFLFNDAINGCTYNGLNWAYQVKKILENLGFNYVWNYQFLDKITYNEIKQRLLDSTYQELMMSINTSTKLQSYCIFKVDTEHESYLDTIKQSVQICIKPFRLSSHPLYIETDRYTGIFQKKKDFVNFVI